MRRFCVILALLAASAAQQGSTTFAPQNAISRRFFPTPRPEGSPWTYAINAGSANAHFNSMAVMYNADPLTSDTRSFTIDYGYKKRIHGSSQYDQTLYQTERTTKDRDFYYFLPMPTTNGKYDLELKFCENYVTEPGQRKFNVSLHHEVELLTDLDVYSQAGPSTAYDVTLELEAKDGVLFYQGRGTPFLAGSMYIAFVRGEKGDPFLNALRITQRAEDLSKGDQKDSKEPAVIFAVNVGGMDVQDSDGVYYKQDPLQDMFGKGYSLNHMSKLSALPGMLQQEGMLFCTERYTDGHSFGYEIDIPKDGQYVMVLRFVEHYYTEAGSRVFNVEVNGKLNVVSNLDIFDKVGKDKPYDAIIVFNVSGGNFVQAPDYSVPMLPGNKIRVDFVKGRAGYPTAVAMYVTEESLRDVKKKPGIANVEKMKYNYYHYAVNIGGYGYTDTNGITYNSDVTYGEPTEDSMMLEVPYDTLIGEVPEFDSTLYRTQRIFYKDNFAYNVTKMAEGSYVLVLKFCENFYTSEGQRLFNVLLNKEHLVAEDLDVFKEAGGNGIAYDLHVPFEIIGDELFYQNESSPVVNGEVKVEFMKGSKDYPAANALYVMKGSLGDLPLKTGRIRDRTGEATVYAINAGGDKLKDSEGTYYDADPLLTFKGEGNVLDYGKTKNITGASMADQALYQTERYAQKLKKFSYRVPLDDGSYVAVFKFCENFFSSPGDRVFDVVMGSHKVIKDCDIYKEVGEGAAYDVKVRFWISNGYYHVHDGNRSPMEDGKELLIEFVGIKESPVLNALVIRKDNRV